MELLIFCNAIAPCKCAAVENDTRPSTPATILVQSLMNEEEEEEDSNGGLFSLSILNFFHQSIYSFNGKFILKNKIKI